MQKNKKNQIKKISEINKKILFGIFILSFFLGIKSNALANTITIGNSPYYGNVTVNLNKTSYVPGEDVFVFGNINVQCYSGSICAGSYITTYIKASDSYGGTYDYLPKVFKAPDSGSFTIYIKYGYSTPGIPSMTGETQITGTVGEIPDKMNVIINATPNPVSYGSSTNITWKSEGASSCTGNVNGLTGTTNTGAGLSYIIKKNKLFILNCTGPDPAGGTRELSGEVLVKVKEASVSNASITEVKTGRAEPVRATKAKLWGSLNPGGLGNAANAKVYFRYSSVSPHNVTPIFCNDIYGSNMRGSREFVVWGNTPQEVNIEIGNLAPNTTYYYCVVGSNDKEIQYGGVSSFTTWPESNISIETKNALIPNETSAFLNGFYNTNVETETWFEYREYNQDKKAFSEWKKVGKESHQKQTNGKISYELKGLSSGEEYQYKAVARDVLNNEIKNGTLETFTTKGDSSSNNGTTPGGIGYTDPCTNNDDINCNGTGGGSNITFGNGGPVDLTAGSISPTNAIVNVPTTFYTSIKNIGGNSTNKSFYSLFQISTINRDSTPAPIYEFKNNPPAQTGNTLSKLLNIFKTKKVNAANTVTGNNTVADNTLVNLPSVLVPEIRGGSSDRVEISYTYKSVGIYYMRACADKNSVADAGIIQEAYENNNCGPWTKIIIGTAEEYNNDGGFSSGSGNNNYNDGNVNNTGNLTLGQTATPPIDAIVRYHEGIEHVFVRQIKNNLDLRESYGYTEGMNLDTFAWDLADLLARTFGYVNSARKEIRVSKPDIAAYQLSMNNGILTVYEYYDGMIVNIQKMTEALRGKYDYEYYFKK